MHPPLQLGVTAGSQQRQRFQMAAALQQRSLGPPGDMTEAVRVSRPQPPPTWPKDGSWSPYAATLPGVYSRPGLAGGSGGPGAALGDGGAGGSYGGAGARASSPPRAVPGVVASVARPRSELSPPRAASPPGMHEVMTPFGSRVVNNPAAHPPKPPGSMSYGSLGAAGLGAASPLPLRRGGSNASKQMGTLSLSGSLSTVAPGSPGGRGGGGGAAGLGGAYPSGASGRLQPPGLGKPPIRFGSGPLPSYQEAMGGEGEGPASANFLPKLA